MATESLPHLNKANLAVHLAAAREDSRYALNYVLVNGVGTVATNGHWLAEVSYPMNDGQPADVPKDHAKFLDADDAKEAFRSYKAKDSSALVTDDGELLVTNRSAVSTFSFSPIKPTFPDYEQVIPCEEPKAKVRLDAKLLAELLKVALELNKPNTRRLSGESPDRPQHFRGRPCRSDRFQSRGLIEQLRRKFPRHYRDQCRRLLSLKGRFEEQLLRQACERVLHHNCASYKNLRQAAEYLHSSRRPASPAASPAPAGMPQDLGMEIRRPDYYDQLLQEAGS